MATRRTTKTQHVQFKIQRQARHRKQVRIAQRLWRPITKIALESLRELVKRHNLSVSCGDLVYFQAGWYVTHAGLLRLARRSHCIGIDVSPVAEFSNPATLRWAFKATVYKSPKCRGFVGYGDADPANVSPLVHGAEMRVAKTRAVNRALRKAYGIGICSVEEIGSFAEPVPSPPEISQYLSCPRRYKHRYLDGWKEKDTRAAMLFGRAFEQAVAAYFQRQDAAAALYREWASHRDSGLHYSERDSWDSMLQSGVQLLDRFAQDDRVRIRQPRRNMQVKFTKPLAGQNDFVAYVDAIGELDGTRCLLEWKTTASRYPEEPSGLLALDPQLVCYSWVTGIADVAQVVFVRKRLAEIQYFRTTISDEQREEFGHLVQDSIRRIESAEFLPHSGIRFPQNPCTSCPYIGLCLGRPDLTEAALVRRPGADDLGWLDELAY